MVYRKSDSPIVPMKRVMTVEGRGGHKDCLSVYSIITREVN